MGKVVPVARFRAILYGAGDLHNGGCMGAMCNGVPLRQTPAGSEGDVRLGKRQSESGETDPLESVFAILPSPRAVG
jgi:hypothetical protein